MSKTQRTVKTVAKTTKTPAQPETCPFDEFDEERAAWFIRSNNQYNGIMLDTKDRLWCLEKGEWKQVTLSYSAEWRNKWQAATLMLEVDPIQEGGKCHRWFELVTDKLEALEGIQSTFWRKAA